MDRWYAQPLSDADGHTPLEIEQVARRIGKRLPDALSEWYELVGRRMREVQDSPRPLGKLTIENRGLCVWNENQGVWSIVAPVDAGDDPVCHVTGDFTSSPNKPLSQTLFGMLVSDTLLGAGRIGTLGELRSTVRGGYCESFTEVQVHRLHTAYKMLDYSLNPFFDEPYRGDEATVVRFHNNLAIEWMTATDEAFATLDDILDLAPDGGEHEVVVAFERLSAEQLRSITRSDGEFMYLPDIELFKTPLAGVGRIASAVGGNSPRFHISTREPKLVLERVLAALPSHMLPKLTVTTRPVAISVFAVLFPSTPSTS